MRPEIIAIVGGSGSGKTWLAEQLVLRLDGLAGRLTLDDFYRDLSELPMEERARTNFDSPAAIDWSLFQNVLGQIILGRSPNVPIYDFSSHCRQLMTRRWEPRPLVVLEGLWLLRRKSIRQRCRFSVFIDCDEETRLARRLQRDQEVRKRSPESIRDQFNRHVLPMHRRYVHGQARWANIVVDSGELEGRLSELVISCRRFVK